jgi:hypothetical protein
MQAGLLALADVESVVRADLDRTASALLPPRPPARRFGRFSGRFVAAQ